MKIIKFFTLIFTVMCLHVDAQVNRHSYSSPDKISYRHLSWKANIDFEKKEIRAQASFHLLHHSAAEEIVLDVKGLVIDQVNVDGVSTPWQVEHQDPILGSALRIPLNAQSKELKVAYHTTNESDALLWVEGDLPFLFTQSQAILARTWIPCQDLPAVRFTYDAEVTVPAHLLPLMSARNPKQLKESREATSTYHFEQPKPIPSYLMALAVGNIEYRAISPRAGVYATPQLITEATEELSDLEKMIAAAEGLYGPYQWEQFDVLILPPAFPFGGMENPMLTFATPTILAGDKSLVSLIAHELAHSWSGNLVTNETWDDFWLNEGFTVYFEQRIMEAVYGAERAEMLAQLARQDLDATVAELDPRDTHLKLALENRNPDDGMNDIAYNKGYFFLRLIEQTVGREKFDLFLKNYFTSHAFQVMDTESFLTYLKENLINEELEKQIDIQAWVYGPGLPSNIPSVNSKKLDEVDAIRSMWETGKPAEDIIPWNDWSYQERYRFISNFSSAVTLNMMTSFDSRYKVTQIGNNEVLFAWLEQSILHKYTPAYGRLEEFLTHVGRRKFVAPLFEAMVKTGQVDLAKKIYTKARPTYHAVTVSTIDEMLKGK